MNDTFSYTSEDDKCYGATGMAIAVVVYDSEDMLASISLDASPEQMLEYVDDFFFAGNPGLSAKSAWNQILKNFNLTMALTIANVMCRSMVLDRKPVADELRTRLHDVVMEEGRDTCSLDDDETERLFDKNYHYLYRIFNHQGVHGVAHDFADSLKRMRRMSRMEVVDRLRALNMI